MPSTQTKVPAYNILLTGGAGFLGKAILHELLGKDALIPVNLVKVLDLKPMASISDPRISFIQGDVRDSALLDKSCMDIDLVIHSAAIVDWGTKSREEIMSVNYQATLNAIEAARANGVKALVFTSSLDVLFDGKPLKNVNEETPYPASHSTSYCESKYLAELAVLEANDDQLRTSIIRPSDIYGEGDPYHIGSLIQMARGGFYVRLGNGQSLCQHVYVRNVAHAHIGVSKALLNGHPGVDGQAYFITDGPASNFFTFFDRFVEGAGYRIWPKNIWLPRCLAYSMGCVSEAVAFLWRPIKKYSPKMSRFAVTYTCTDYTFGSDKARLGFGFAPKYSREESFERTVDYFRKKANQ
ncbi:MAG: NAD-dependent epimerase/dehydratase family protein [Bacteroidia bacterium]|nr:MAG: NAD-dependent epimerase/dehydratase family protein [Bacteroidia bacterium]